MSDFLTNLVDMAWGRAVVAQPKRLSRFDPTPYREGLLGQNPAMSQGENDWAASEGLDTQPANSMSPVGESEPLAEFSSPVKRPPLGGPAPRPPSADGAIDSAAASSEPAPDALQTEKTMRRPTRRSNLSAPPPTTARSPEMRDETLSPVMEDGSLRQPLPKPAGQSAAQPANQSMTAARRADAAILPATLPVDGPSTPNKNGWYEAARTRIAAVAQSHHPVAADELGAPAMLSSNAERVATIRPQTRPTTPASVEETEDRVQLPVIARQPDTEPEPPALSLGGERQDSNRIAQAPDASERPNSATKPAPLLNASSQQPQRQASRFTITPQIVPLPGNDRSSDRRDDKQSTPEPPPQPTIHVSIGRVEVRATPPPAAPVRKPSPRPILSLDDYLRGRKEGNR